MRSFSSLLPKNRGLVLPILLALTVGATARDFRAADIQSHDYPTVLAIQRMAELVSARTGGAHRVNIFHSRQLGEEGETIEQTRVGAIDINRINVAPLATLAPELRVLGLPFLFRSDSHLRKVLDGPVGVALSETLEAHGLVVLTFYDSGARSIYNSVRPVRTLADIKGLRIRIQQSEVAESMIRAMGAEPIVLPYGQVPTALATKLIDGAENNWPSYVTTDHYKVARYYTATEHTMAPEVLVMSKKVWDTLTERERNIFKVAARESSQYMSTLWQASEEKSRQLAVAAGNDIIINFNRGAFEAAMAPIIEHELKDPVLRSHVDRIRATR